MARLSRRGVLVGLGLASAEARAELNKLACLVAEQRLMLEAAGIEPPSREGAGLVQLCRSSAALVRSSADFVQGLGSARELLEDSWVK